MFNSSIYLFIHLTFLQRQKPIRETINIDNNRMLYINANIID